MRRLIFSILTGFAGIAAWGQTPVAAHPTAANDTLTEDSINKHPEYGCPTSGFPLMVLPARRCM